MDYLYAKILVRAIYLLQDNFLPVQSVQTFDMQRILNK